MKSNQTSAPLAAVQPRARLASQPPMGPATSDMPPINPSRSALRRPVAPKRCPVSTSNPPTVVLTTTTARLSPIITASSEPWRAGTAPRAIQDRHEATAPASR